MTFTLSTAERRNALYHGQVLWLELAALRLRTDLDLYALPRAVARFVAGIGAGDPGGYVERLAETRFDPARVCVELVDYTGQMLRGARSYPDLGEVVEALVEADRLLRVQLAAMKRAQESTKPW